MLCFAQSVTAFFWAGLFAVGIAFRPSLPTPQTRLYLTHKATSPVIDQHDLLTGSFLLTPMPMPTSLEAVETLTPLLFDDLVLCARFPAPCTVASACPALQSC